jgi:NAD(P)-dependent dehydrogenase (short-subunit alcohol dehydrogenase family)
MVPSEVMTTDRVLDGSDLSGRCAVVTGASSGLGQETARAFAAAGARVFLGVRDQSAGEQVAATIREIRPGADVTALRLDLSSLSAVGDFARELLAQTDCIDILINNAGVMGTPLSRTTEGFEMQFGVNHLGHFVLTGLLNSAVRASGNARIVNLSSGGHSISDVIWDDPNYEHRVYDKREAYGQSKTANVLFSVGLEPRLCGYGVHAYAVHPGMVSTNLARYLEKGDFRALMERGRAKTSSPDVGSQQASSRVAVKTIAEGAATTVWAVVAPIEESGGSYLEDCRIPSAATWASDPSSAERLWAVSEEMVSPWLGGMSPWSSLPS